MLRPESEVFAAFAEDYNGPTVDIDGYDYVPWPQVVRILDRVVGPGNWSDRVMFTDYQHDRGTYTTGVELSITFAADEHGGSKTITRFGVSTQVAQASKRERDQGLSISATPKTHETAIDGSASLARTKASKTLGNAFGLKMYKHAEEFGEAASAPAPRKPSYTKPAANGNGANAKSNGGSNGAKWEDAPALEDVKEDTADKEHRGLTKAQLNAAKRYGADLASLTRGEVKRALETKGASLKAAATASRTGTPDDYEDDDEDFGAAF